ncbi:baeRF12 domain-containing protein [Alsobacter sp. R-9]
MTTARISHGTWILVSDGRKALLLHQDGDHDLPNFSVRHVLEAPENPRTAEQGTDRPVLTRPANGAGGSTTGQTDWHEQAERAFARQTVTTVARLLQEADDATRLVVVAPPKTLHVLREDMSPQMRAIVVGEMAKDYVRHPIGEIETLLTKG